MLGFYFATSIPAVLFVFLLIQLVLKYIRTKKIIAIWKYVAIGASLFWSTLISNGLHLYDLEHVILVAMSATAIITISIIYIFGIDIDRSKID